MNRLILHIGPHKTGSTALQKALMSNGPLLAANGYVYPKKGLSFFGHHQLCSAIIEDTDRLPDIVHSIRESDSLVILSSENFASLTRTQLRRLARVVECNAIKIIFYLRNFITLPYSWWQEEVKSKKTLTFSRFFVDLLTCQMPMYPFNAAEVLDNYAGVFGEDSINVYLYDDVMAEFGDVRPHFFSEVLKIFDVPQIDHERLNCSLSLHAVECIRHLNRMGLDGHREYWLWRESPILGEFAERILDHTYPINIDYNNTVFSSFESDVGRWINRIINYNSQKKNLFELRNITINCFDEDAWLHDLDFTKRFQEFLNKAFNEYITRAENQASGPNN